MSIGTTSFTETVVEDATLGWLASLGYAVLHGPDIAAGEPGGERSDANYRDVQLEGRLRQGLVRLNPDLPPEALEDAYRLPAEDSAQAGKLTRTDAPPACSADRSLLERNRAVHRMPVCVHRTGRLVDGVTVEYRRKDGSIAGAQARVIDFDPPACNARAGAQAGKPDNNDWLAVNQFTAADLPAGQAGGQHTRPACAANQCGAAGRRAAGCSCRAQLFRIS